MKRKAESYLISKALATRETRRYLQRNNLMISIIFIFSVLWHSVSGSTVATISATLASTAQSGDDYIGTVPSVYLFSSQEMKLTGTTEKALFTSAPGISTGDNLRVYNEKSQLRAKYATGTQWHDGLGMKDPLHILTGPCCTNGVQAKMFFQMQEIVGQPLLAVSLYGTGITDYIVGLFRMYNDLETVYMISAGKGFIVRINMDTTLDVNSQAIPSTYTATRLIYPLKGQDVYLIGFQLGGFPIVTRQNFQIIKSMAMSASIFVSRCQIVDNLNEKYLYSSHVYVEGNPAYQYELRKTDLDQSDATPYFVGTLNNVITFMGFFNNCGAFQFIAIVANNIPFADIRFVNKVSFTYDPTDNLKLVGVDASQISLRYSSSPFQVVNDIFHFIIGVTTTIAPLQYTNIQFYSLTFDKCNNLQKGLISPMHQNYSHIISDCCVPYDSKDCQIDYVKQRTSINTAKAYFSEPLASQIFDPFKLTFYPQQDLRNPNVLSPREYKITTSQTELKIEIIRDDLDPNWILDLELIIPDKFPIKSENMKKTFRNMPIRFTFPPEQQASAMSSVGFAVGSSAVGAGVIAPIIALAAASAGSTASLGLGMMVFRGISSLTYLPFLNGPFLNYPYALFKNMMGVTSVITPVYKSLDSFTKRDNCADSDTLYGSSFHCNYLKNYGTASFLLLMVLTLTGSITFINQMINNDYKDFQTDKIVNLKRPRSMIKNFMSNLSIDYFLTLIESLSLQIILFACIHYFFGNVRSTPTGVGFAAATLCVYFLLYILYAQFMLVKLATKPRNHNSINYDKSNSVDASIGETNRLQSHTELPSTLDNKTTTQITEPMEHNSTATLSHVLATSSSCLVRFLTPYTAIKPVPKYALFPLITTLRSFIIPLMLCVFADRGVVQLVIVLILEVVYLLYMIFWNMRLSMLCRVTDLMTVSTCILYNILRMISAADMNEEKRQEVLGKTMAILVLIYTSALILISMAAVIITLLHKKRLRKHPNPSPPLTTVQPNPPN